MLIYCKIIFATTKNFGILMIVKRAVYFCILLICIGCSEKKTSSVIVFSPVFNTHPIECNKAIDIQETAWFVSQLQFFVSNIELQNSQGQWHKPTFEITPEQTENVALIGNACQGSEAGNWQLKFANNINFDDVNAIRFSLGVPFEQNHLNPLTQASPLNVSSMFWVWQTGHKFARIEMNSEFDDWLFHLGSTGCKSPSVMRSPSDACLYPNLYTMELALTDTNEIVFDLANLLGDLKLSMETSCQSEHDNAACQQLFSHLNQEDEHTVFRTILND